MKRIRLRRKDEMVSDKRARIFHQRVAFLDSDDNWYPKKIAEQARIFDEDSEVGLVYSNGYAIDEMGILCISCYRMGLKRKTNVVR